MAAVEAYIGMGSNLGDGIAILSRAWQSLGEIEGVHNLALSSPYKTAPVDMSSHHWFTNAVGRVVTALPPEALLEELLGVETSFGRKRDAKSFGYQDRVLDLDLLYYGDLLMDTPDLILPHPRIKDRLFVLVPLIELAPDHKDPLSGATAGSMVEELKQRMRDQMVDQQEVIGGSWEERN
ncbi:MAG: 2-amino-4-hydroxy-6-hydroxymethyldihydropteridine diphosphokinase [Deltaproteobacteria bacterium]|nr:2-amino-4-hydroxy-6-hydroxymethyldihydropteridine diphosphokinase [Deltaproteobacteria bacterium]MBW2658526.1 2-amino-4-hydroxy-6-hydroxymethyldihydropteridine diphosphokinase [Deltaproteobacteria bacterium]